MDGTVRTTNSDTGEKSSLSLKCTELDKHIPDLLGVSASLMENVIFCHQEESSWPMQEGATLKKKFDDIFESSRYTKALEAFSKAKKDFQSKAKDIKGIMLEFGAHLQAANQYKMEQTECEEHIEQCNEELESSKGHIERINQKLERINKTIQNAEKYEGDLNSTRSQISELERRVADRMNTLDGERQEPDSELLSLLANFEGQMQQKQTEMRDLMRQSEILNKEISNERARIDELNVSLGTANSLQEHYKLENQKYMSLASEMATAYEVPQVPTSWSISATRSYSNAIEGKVKEIQASFDQGVGDLKRRVAEREATSNEARTSFQKLEQDSRAKHQERTRLQGEKDNCQIEQGYLGHASTIRNQFETAERDFLKAKTEADDYGAGSKNKSADLARQIKDVNESIRTQTEEYAADASILQTLNMYRSKSAELKAMQSNIEDEAQNIRADGVRICKGQALLNDVPHVLDTVGGYDELLAKLSTIAAEQAAQNVAEKTRLDLAVSNSTQAEVGLKGERNKLTMLRTKLGAIVDNETKILDKLRHCSEVLNSEGGSREVCNMAFSEENEDGDGNVDENRPFNCDKAMGASSYVEGFAKKLKAARSELNGYFRAKRRLLDKMKKKNKCPCCEAVLTPEKAIETNASIEKMLKTTCRVEDIDELHKMLEDNLPELKKWEEELKERPSLVAQQTECDDKLQQLTGELSRCKSAESELRAAMTESDAIKSSAQKTHSLLSDNKQRFTKILQKRSSHEVSKREHSERSNIQGGETRSIEEIEEQQRNRMEIKDQQQTLKDKLLKEDSETMKRGFQLRANLTGYERSLQEAKQKKEKYEDFDAREKAASEALRRLEAEVRVVEASLEEAARVKDERARALGESKMALENEQQSGPILRQLERIRASRDKLKVVAESLEYIYLKSKDLDADKLRSDVEERMLKISKSENEIRSKEPKIKSIQSEMSSQERTKKSVRENLDIRKMRRERDELADALEEMQKKIGTDAGSLTQAKNDQRRSLTDLNKAKSSVDVEKGKLEIYQQQKHDIQRKLAGSSYVDIEERHRKKSIEYETTEMAVKDLDSYYGALYVYFFPFPPHHFNIYIIYIIIFFPFFFPPK